ncbi:MAG TPA: hypothetical protein VMA35_09925 [Candidatus Sulfopaludibacter sp.]|nr:hypothetical protein [Candidatus Sulfopaludibacter sp.]
MDNILKINFRRQRRLTSLLGLSLDGGRLEGVVLRRTNGALQRLQSFSVALSLDPLTDAPELVGREIRNHLDAAGIRERRCVVGLPLKWLLTISTEVPPLAEADVAGFLQLEAERGFPSDVTTLRVAGSCCPLAGGRQHATQVGVPISHLALLERVLQAAKLKPVSFAIGLTALQPQAAETSQDVLALLIGETQVGLQITCGGGVVALRALEGALETEGGRHTLQANVVSRETRITLGQLPPELRDAVKRIRIFGPGDLAQQLADEMELRFEPMGLQVEVVKHYSSNEFGIQLPADTPVAPVFSLAARWLTDQAPTFEFLPPKPSAWQQIVTKYSSGRLQTIGAVAAGMVLIVVGVFGFQQWELMRLRSQWSAMSAKVKELDTLQQRILQYHPWFDASFSGLSILRQLSLSFPEDGVVSARTVEIHNGNVVTCSGVSRDNTALLAMWKQLATAGGVNDLKVDQIRGKSPGQFSFSFVWGNGVGDEEGGDNEN